MVQFEFKIFCKLFLGVFISIIFKVVYVMQNSALEILKFIFITQFLNTNL